MSETTQQRTPSWWSFLFWFQTFPGTDYFVVLLRDIVSFRCAGKGAIFLRKKNGYVLSFLISLLRLLCALCKKTSSVAFYLPPGIESSFCKRKVPGIRYDLLQLQKGLRFLLRTHISIVMSRNNGQKRTLHWLFVSCRNLTFHFQSLDPAFLRFISIWPFVFLFESRSLCKKCAMSTVATQQAAVKVAALMFSFQPGSEV